MSHDHIERLRSDERDGRLGPQLLPVLGIGAIHDPGLIPFLKPHQLYRDHRYSDRRLLAVGLPRRDSVPGGRLLAFQAEGEGTRPFGKQLGREAPRARLTFGAFDLHFVGGNTSGFALKPDVYLTEKRTGQVSGQRPPITPHQAQHGGDTATRRGKVLTDFSEMPVAHQRGRLAGLDCDVQ